LLYQPKTMYNYSMGKYNLLSVEDYLKKKDKDSAVIKFSKNNQHIYCVGTRHFLDPEHPDVCLIDKAWEDFLDKTGGINCVTLVEGSIRKFINHKEASIKYSGEGGYATYLATNQGIEIYCPEPPMSYQLRKLQKEFTTEQVLLYFFVRWVVFYGKREERNDMEKIIAKAIHSLKLDFSGERVEISEVVLKNLYNEVVEKDIASTRMDEMRNLTLPLPNKTLLNNISFADMRIRDEWIVSQIEKLWNEGKNIFIVYGRTHLYIQEPAIKEIVEGSDLS
jgi:hypothetical protein